MSNALQPHGLQSSWNSQGQNTGVEVPFPSQGDLCNQGIKLRSPTMQTDSLQAEPPEKPFVGSPNFNIVLQSNQFRRKLGKCVEIPYRFLFFCLQNMPDLCQRQRNFHLQPKKAPIVWGS